MATETIVELECASCHLMQFYSLEYEGADWDTGIRGGWSGWLLAINDQEYIETDYTLEERCHCPFSDEEREKLGYAVAKDYGPGDEPHNL